MDGHQVEKCQQVIRDDMVVYKNALECILSISENDMINTLHRVLAIQEICMTTLNKL